MHRKLAVVLFLATLSVASAQEVPTPPALPAPYEADLVRLSEVLGGVHYLRPLCGHEGEQSLWRDEMEAVLEAEEPEEALRRRLVDAFNRGYESFRAVYRTCTPAATVAAERYLQEGVKLSAEITARYGSSE